VDVGLIKRIRGLVYTARIAPTTANRVIDKCRQVLNTFIPDVYLYTDHYTGKEAGV
jgi:RNA 3'-terminal phosphate cyclase-like protein